MSGLRLATSRPLAERSEPCLAAKRQPRVTKSREVDLRPAPYLIRQRTFWKSSRAFVRNEIEWRLNKSSLRVAITTLWRNRLSSIRFSVLPYHSNSYFTLLSGLGSAAGRRGRGGGVVVTHFYKPDRYVPPRGQSFCAVLVWKRFWTGIGYGFPGNYRKDCMNVSFYRFNSKCVRMDFHCRVIFQCMKCRA